jgi:hypothetical protein
MMTDDHSSAALLVEDAIIMENVLIDVRRVKLDVVQMALMSILHSSE